MQGTQVSMRLLIQKGCWNIGECLYFMFLFVLNLIQFIKVLVGYFRLMFLIVKVKVEFVVGLRIQSRLF